MGTKRLGNDESVRMRFLLPCSNYLALKFFYSPKNYGAIFIVSNTIKKPSALFNYFTTLKKYATCVLRARKLCRPCKNYRVVC